MSKKYLLGVDGGTEGIRAGIFDISGTPLAFASTLYLSCMKIIPPE
jgi:sugar (pentulose or hexulose) kinase